MFKHLLPTSLQRSKAEAVNISVPHLLFLSANGPTPSFSLLYVTRLQTLSVFYAHDSCSLIHESDASYLMFSVILSLTTLPHRILPAYPLNLLQSSHLLMTSVLPSSFLKHMLTFLITFNPSHLTPHYKQVKFTLYYSIHPYHFQTSKIFPLLLNRSLAFSVMHRATSAGTLSH